MTIEEIRMIRYHCDARPRLDCWKVEEYECDEDAEKDGWATNGKKHLCPYCASKVKEVKKDVI
jgi:hypothetical protein